jgi:hypothetical protein
LYLSPLTSSQSLRWGSSLGGGSSIVIAST